MTVAGGLWMAGDILCQTIAPEPTHLHELSVKQPSTTRDSLSIPTAANSTIANSSTNEKSKGLDWNRVLLMTSFGVFIAGPLYTVWYRFLDKNMEPLLRRVLKRRAQGIPTLNLSYANMVWKVTLAKVAADMLLFDPPYLSLFFVSTHLGSGGTFREATQQLRKEFPSTYTIDLLLWTPIQLLNFRFVPVPLQPQVVNVVNVGWNAFLSYVKHK